MESSSPGDGLVATVPHVYSGALLHGLFANEFCGRRDLRIALKFIRYPHEGFWILPQYIPKRLAAVFADRTGCTHCFLQWIYRRLGGWCGHRHCHMHIRGGPSKLWQILRRFFPAPDDAAQFIRLLLSVPIPVGKPSACPANNLVTLWPPPNTDLMDWYNWRKSVLWL